MLKFLVAILFLFSGAAAADVWDIPAELAHTTDMALANPPITVMVLSNKAGIPEGWMDSTTRQDATDLCIKLIETQSSFYANAISRSRCLIKVQEK